MHYDPSVTNSDPNAAPINTATGATAAANLLQRYYGLSLPACKDSNYKSPGSGYDNITLPAGACGWTQSIFYQGDNQNTEFDALQVTLTQTFAKGLAYTANYEWASAFDAQTNYFTWNSAIDHGRDSNVRDQQLNLYGSYDFPFGRGKQFVPNANRMTDLFIGGFQLSGVMSRSSGLPFTLNYNEASSNVPGSVPTYPSYAGGGHMRTNLTSYVPNGTGTGTRTFYQQQTTNLITDPGTGMFKNPGLDTIGNVGFNTYFGPGFFTSDLAITKAFTIWENIATKFRMDAFNAFNHINPGNPGGNIESAGIITSEANGCVGSTCGPRQLEFSLRVQF